jgi:hypothetical protein
MAYGVLVIVVGLAVAFSGFASRIQAGSVGDAQRLLFGPLTDMIFFAAFLRGAWVYRRKPEIHKRLIVVATTTLLIAAVSRMPYWRRAQGLSFQYVSTSMLVWLSPIYVAMAYDYSRQRIVHPVYVIGIVSLGILRLRGRCVNPRSG